MDGAGTTIFKIVIRESNESKEYAFLQHKNATYLIHTVEETQMCGILSWKTDEKVNRTLGQGTIPFRGRGV